MYESKQVNVISKEKLLKQVDNWYYKNATAKVNEMRFDIESDINLFGFRIVQAIERILRTDLACDFTITEQYLEKLKKLLKTL